MLEAADIEVMVGDPTPLRPQLCLLEVLRHGDTMLIELATDYLPFGWF